MSRDQVHAGRRTPPEPEAGRIPSPQPGWRLLRESQAIRELPRLAWRLPELTRQARGNGETVLVFPGFGAGDSSTVLLRAYLRLMGYRVRGWGLGANGGDVPALISQVVELTARTAEQEEAPIRLLGWSLGGYLAREAAREEPQAVDRVITLGSPVVGGPKYTAAASTFARRGLDLDAIEEEVEARNATPISAPITAIYSRTDSVVAWQACIDRNSPDVEHVEVSSTHVGLGFDPDVYSIVSDRLAREPRSPHPGRHAGCSDQPGAGAV